MHRKCIEMLRGLGPQFDHSLSSTCISLTDVIERSLASVGGWVPAKPAGGTLGCHTEMRALEWGGASL